MSETTTYRFTPGTATAGENASVFVPAGERRPAHLRPSTPLRAGAPVYRVVVTMRTKDGRTVEDAATFRKPGHASAWLALVDHNS